MRALILIHRYIGIVIGLVMAMWCASGFVMMYEGYPSPDESMRMRALAPIDWQGCCAYDKIAKALDVDVADSFSVEMTADRPVLTIAMSRGRRQLFDLRSGEQIEAFDRDSATAVARRFATSIESAAPPRYLGSIERDQWTVPGQFNRDRPLHHFTLDDAKGTELYVSSTTGTIVQHTDRTQRFWNWLGAVPHWLYPTVLRQHGAAWAQTVIYLSLAGVFLTVIGLYIGIDHWRAMKGTRLSPYRGVPLWHHVSGLFFGVLTLTWVGSGLLSMSPWGLLEGSSFRAERAAVRDAWIDGPSIAATLKALAARANSRESRIEAAPLGGKLYVLLHDGPTPVRVDAQTLAASPLAKKDVDRIASQVANSHTTQIDYLTEGDRYYYSGHDPRTFPVYRIALDDADQTRYYVDAMSGDIVDKIDPNRRAYRWLFEGLHRFDFVPAMRARPWWDLLMIPLLLGVTIVCFTGVYMGYKRVRVWTRIDKKKAT